jgi:hypothetical protein
MLICSPGCCYGKDKRGVENKLYLFYQNLFPCICYTRAFSINSCSGSRNKLKKFQTWNLQCRVKFVLLLDFISFQLWFVVCDSFNLWNETLIIQKYNLYFTFTSTVMLLSAFSPQSVLRHIHSLFQSEFCTEYDLVNLLSVSNIMSFSWDNPVAATIIFHVFPSLVSFLLSFL